MEEPTSTKAGTEMETKTAIILTNAPAAYDYGYTVDLDNAPATGGFIALLSENDRWMCSRATGIIRSVVVPVGNANYQHGRYLSGMYLSVILNAPVPA